MGDVGGGNFSFMASTDLIEFFKNVSTEAINGSRTEKTYLNFKSLEIIPILFTPESGGKMLKNLISPILKYSLIDQFRVFLFHGLISRGLDVFISTKNKIHKYLRERGEAAPHVLFVRTTNDVRIPHYFVRHCLHTCF